MKKVRDFTARPAEEQRWMLVNTWCDVCNQADLGMTNPVEYEKDEKVYLEGTCCRCGRTVVNLITEHDSGAS
jgi:hypothetical protein